jgi:hypothetical protein
MLTHHRCGHACSGEKTTGGLKDCGGEDSSQRKQPESGVELKLRIKKKRGCAVSYWYTVHPLPFHQETKF